MSSMAKVKRGGLSHTITNSGADFLKKAAGAEAAGAISTEGSAAKKETTPDPKADAKVCVPGPQTGQI